jgi:NAD(P)-dependent dehydrogenase (short-subunit alcohol dehydrogenase family)
VITLDLTNKVVAVTGGFGALGQAVGRTLLAAGARVALIDRMAAAALPAGLETALAVAGADVGTPEGAGEALGQVVAQCGRLDGLVNVAGGFRWETLESGAVDTWDLMYAMNLRTAVSAARAALPHLPADGSGRIVNIGALAAAKAAAGMGAYAAAKAGVARLTEALAEELKDRGVTVNAVLPSIIDTPANRADMPQADFTRWVAPEQVAELVVFLLSARAGAITGSCIPVAGRV